MLAENNYFYPGWGQNHTFLAVCAVEDIQRWPFPIRRRMDNLKSGREFRQKCLDYLSNSLVETDHETVIFSSESLSFLSTTECQTLYDLLTPFFSKIVVVCYVRHPLSYANSHAQQAIKGGMRTLRELNEAAIIFHHSIYEKSYYKVFGKDSIIAREFENNALLNGDIIDDFCSVVGIPSSVSTCISRVRVNESLSMEGALISDAISEIAPRYIDGKWNNERSMNLSGILTEISGGRFSTSAITHYHIADKIEKEAEYIRAKFGLSLTPPKPEKVQSNPMWGPNTLRDIGLLFNKMGNRIEKLKFDNSILSIRLLLSDNKPNIALAQLEQVFDKIPLSPEYFLLKASIYEKMGSEDKEIAALRSGIEKFPDSKKIRNSL